MNFSERNQVLTTEQDTVVLFKLKNLIHFYLHVVKSIVVSPAPSSAPNAAAAAATAAAVAATSVTTETVAAPSSSSSAGDVASTTTVTSAPSGDNSIVATLGGLHGLADKMFLNALNCQGE